MSARSKTTVERQMDVSDIKATEKPCEPQPEKNWGEPEKSRAPLGLLVKASGPEGGAAERLAVTSGAGAGTAAPPTSCAMPAMTGGSAAAP
jgi:hypothetical protein